ncbi:MAG: MarR family winged helix-turn-helix transcriptional regulator [Cellulosilyticaceae bacterium]
MSNADLPKVSEDIFRLVIKLNDTIFKQDEFLRSMPLPPSHVKVIFYLVHNSPTTMSEMAQKLCISKSNMTPIIDKLIEEGLAERAENPKDRRTILITTTDKAVELFESHKKLIKERLASRIECLSPEDLATLHQSILMALPLLDKVNHS